MIKQHNCIIEQQDQQIRELNRQYQQQSQQLVELNNKFNIQSQQYEEIKKKYQSEYNFSVLLDQLDNYLDRKFHR